MRGLQHLVRTLFPNLERQCIRERMARHYLPTYKGDEHFAETITRVFRETNRGKIQPHRVYHMRRL